MRILGLVPARGGSKGVPRKNIRLLRAKPLLAYTAETALQSKLLTRVILSTEDEEIAAVGRQYGLDVPFLRPVELSQDATPTLPVIQHALITLENEDEHYDAVCLLQPTNPLRRAQDIDNCIEFLIRTGADSVVSILPVPVEYNPKWVYWRTNTDRMVLALDEAEPITRRQKLPPAFHRDGTIYLTRTNVLVQQNSLYGSDLRGYEIDPMFSANIDSEEDWLAVEERLSKRY